MTHQVICLDDNQLYGLATSRVFPTHEAAEQYAATIAPARHPVVTTGLADEQDFDGAGMALAYQLAEDNIGGIL